MHSGIWDSNELYVYSDQTVTFFNVYLELLRKKVDISAWVCSLPVLKIVASLRVTVLVGKVSSNNKTSKIDDSFAWAR